jgi:hypothetical protein
MITWNGDEIDSMNKKELHDFIKEKQPNICQISCYKDGKEVYSDEWNDYKKIDTCHVMSATKSVVSLLVGIALDKGFIENIDQPVLDFFHEYKIKRKASQIFELAFVSHHCIDFDGCCNVCTGHTDGSRVFRIYRFIRYHCTDIKQAEQTTSDQ